MAKVHGRVLTDWSLFLGSNFGVVILGTLLSGRGVEKPLPVYFINFRLFLLQQTLCL